MQIDPTIRVKANGIAAENGYSAPYLYLLKDDQYISSYDEATAYTKRKILAVTRAIKAGYGQGRGDAYKPWIRIRRNFSSPTSYQVFDSVSIHMRNHHFLSLLEFHTALLVSYMGADELRECLPLWPFIHPHPYTGLGEESDFNFGQALGLIDIAKKAGIEHGCFIGTTVPYIASIDLMFRIQQKRTWRYIGISCKPLDVTRQSHRAQERIELDRLYCRSIDAFHVHEDGTKINLELVKQVAWMRPLVSDLRAHRSTQQLLDFTAIFNEFSNEYCISDASILAGRKTGLDTTDAYKFFRLGVWLHYIDIDLSQRIQLKKKNSTWKCACYSRTQASLLRSIT